MLRYQDIKDKAYRLLDLTTLTVEEFEPLVKPVDDAFVGYMRVWTMEGKRRSGRAYSQYANCPLPTPEDRLLFILSYLKVASLQVAHGALFNLSQSNANKWIHVLLPALEAGLMAQGDAPARHVVALQERLAVLGTEAMLADRVPAAPLFGTTAPNAQLRAPRTTMSKARIIAARKSDTR